MLFLPLVVACGEVAAPVVVVPSTQYITQARPWLPGERDAFIARVQRTRQLDFLGIEMSDDIGGILSLDSVTEIVANPAWAGPLASPFGPLYSLYGARVPGTGWTTFGLDLNITNTTAGTTTNWLGAMWANNADSTWKGIILAATSATNFPATAVNTTAFDASGGTTGVGAGEAKVTGGATTWLANGTGSPNTFAAAWSFGLGGTTTVTTGPYLGGTRRTLLMSMTLNNVGMTRVLGSQAPATQTASVSGFMIGVQYNCVFPTPCTTNVPGAAAAALRGKLPDSLRVRLPMGLR